MKQASSPAVANKPRLVVHKGERKMKKVDSNECIVCYLDILGYSDFIKNRVMSPQECYKKISNILKQSLLAAKEKPPGDLNKLKKAISFIMLSDSIIITFDLKQFNNGNYFGLPKDNRIRVVRKQFFILVSRFLLKFMLSFKLLVRGGIATGSYFQRPYINKSGLFIYSNAYITAVELEERVASSPRILIENKLAMDIIRLDHNQIIINQDKDGLWFFNIYFPLFSMSKKEGKRLTNKIGTFIINSIEYFEKKTSSLKTLKILQKYYWLNNYHKEKLKELVIRWQSMPLKPKSQS